MSADNIFQQRHTEESVYDVDHLPYSLLYEQPQAPVQSSYTVYSYEPNQQGQYQFIPQRTEAPPSPTYAPQAFPAAPLPPQGVMPPPAVGGSPLKYVAVYWVRGYVPLAIVLLSVVVIFYIASRCTRILLAYVHPVCYTKYTVYGEHHIAGFLCFFL